MATTTFIGLAIADSMFPAECAVSRRQLTVEEVRDLAQQAVSCCNPTHANSLVALRTKHGVEVAVPEKAPRVSLGIGDSVIVMSVRGLPRETREFTDEEISSATFAFGLWTVTG
ncbi:MAG: hypothetical protein KatS3mg087_0377 [Patescibacteria group bacterium]|nr:MAG: hypothetical protein KatS3mg087_0377 [Patescibacteria group bacterium]